MKDALYVLGGLAVIVFFIVRQRRSGRFQERSILFPIALGIYGVVLLTDTSKHLSLNAASAVLLILSGLASIGFGVIRGRTIELFVRGGELWERASWTTIGAGCGRKSFVVVRPSGGLAFASMPASPASATKGAGAGRGLGDVAAVTLIQARAADEVRSRVFAAQDGAAHAAFSVAALAGGLLVQLAGARGAFAAAAAFGVGAALLAGRAPEAPCADG